MGRIGSVSFMAAGFVGRKYVTGPSRPTWAEAEADRTDPKLFPAVWQPVANVWRLWQEGGQWKSELAKAEHA